MILTAGVLLAEKLPLSRYQTLIDRYPFGEPPAGFDPQKMASEVSKDDAAQAEKALTEEQAAIQKSVSFSVINADPDDGGVMVGFSDLADPKVPRHYYMRVGTSRDGWTVKEADLTARTMTVEKDGVEVTLDLGSNSTGGAGKTVAAGAGKPAAGGAVNRLRGRGIANGEVTTAGGTSSGGRSGILRRPGGGLSTFQGRRRQRELEEAQAKADAEEREAARRQREEEAAAQREEEKARLEQERAEAREQIKAISDDIRRLREEKREAAAPEADAAAPEAEGGEGDEGYES